MDIQALIDQLQQELIQANHTNNKVEIYDYQTGILHGSKDNFSSQKLSSFDPVFDSKINLASLKN